MTSSKVPSFVLFILLLVPALWADENLLQHGRVQRVIDGDTLVLETGAHVRLIGINAPEYEPWKNVTEPYGKEAADFAKELLSGKSVALEQDTEPKDKYGRTLAYVYLEDGQMANKILVREGYAKARYYKPNGRYYQLLKEAENEARNLRKGLWGVKIKI